MNSNHLKAAMIVFAITDENPYVTMQKRLDACMHFLRYFGGDPDFSRQTFLRSCLYGFVADAHAELV